MQALIFYLFAAVSVVCSVLMITSRKAVVSALYLVVVMFSLAGLFALQSAHLIAALQVLVYAGAIMVLFLFVIMLLNVQEKTGGRAYHQWPLQIGGVAVLSVLFVPLVAWYSAAGGPEAKEMTDKFGTTAAVGELLYTEYLLPFEIASVLLLAALVGAVILTKTKLR